MSLYAWEPCLFDFGQPSKILLVSILFLQKHIKQQNLTKTSFSNSTASWLLKHNPCHFLSKPFTNVSTSCLRRKRIVKQCQWFTFSIKFSAKWRLGPSNTGFALFVSGPHFNEVAVEWPLFLPKKVSSSLPHQHHVSSRHLNLQSAAADLKVVTVLLACRVLRTPPPPLKATRAHMVHSFERIVVPFGIALTRRRSSPPWTTSPHLKQ